MRLMEWVEEEYKWKKREFMIFNVILTENPVSHNPVKRRFGKS